MRPTLSLLLLCAAFLAGCSDPSAPAPDNPGEEPSPDAAADGGMAADRPAGEDRPAPEAPRAAQGGAPASAAAPAPVLKVIEVQEDGILAPAAGDPGTVMVGANAVPIGGVHDRWFPQDIEGTVVAVDLAMTWTPSPGASTSLRLTFSPTEDVDGGERMTDDRQDVEGESPLRLQLGGLAWDGGRYTVAAWWGGDVAYTPTGQEFHIEGTITYVE